MDWRLPVTLRGLMGGRSLLDRVLCLGEIWEEGECWSWVMVVVEAVLEYGAWDIIRSVECREVDGI